MFLCAVSNGDANFNNNSIDVVGIFSNLDDSREVGDILSIFATAFVVYVRHYALSATDLFYALTPPFLLKE